MHFLPLISSYIKSKIRIESKTTLEKDNSIELQTGQEISKIQY